MSDRMWFEDFECGQTWASPRARLEEAEILEFGRRYDPQAFHTDPVAAEDTIFGGLVASGWHTMAVTMRLFVDHGPPAAGGLVGLGVEELRWPVAVRPGDSVRLEVRVLDSKRSERRPDRGTVRLGLAAFNQDEEQVLSAAATILVPARGADPGGA